MKPKSIALVNQKGGVGKTTTAVNLAWQLADNGFSTLLVDLDPQANATSGLGFEKTLPKNVYEVIVNGKDANHAIQGTPLDNLFLLPSNADLSGAEVELVSREQREFLLKNSLAELGFDIIVIDCPPSLGLLTINALTAASYIITPVQAEYYALEGLGQLMGTVQAIKESTNPGLNVLGVLLTMYDKRNSLSSQVLKEISEYFGDQVFESYIPRNIRLAEAPSFGQTIFTYDRWSKGAKAYKNLAKEVADRLSAA